jgi:hypothetical protein
MRGSSLCRLRLLYSAENREFALERISPSQTIISIKQQIVDAWPSGKLRLAPAAAADRVGRSAWQHARVGPRPRY